jgi:hypothetical protein
MSWLIHRCAVLLGTAGCSARSSAKVRPSADSRILFNSSAAEDMAQFGDGYGAIMALFCKRRHFDGAVQIKYGSKRGTAPP